MTVTRRKKLFRREIFLEKLATAGEISSEILLGLILEFFDFAKAMTLPPQAAQRALRKQAPPRHIKLDLKLKIAFWSLLSKLKKENLIKQNRSGKILITKKGKKYLQQKNEKPLKLIKKYEKGNICNNRKIILVIFDIPEAERNKRTWIRFHLEQLEFKVLQKSVWWGTTGLPKEFIKDLKKYELLPYVHIFSVKDGGTISTIINNT